MAVQADPVHRAVVEHLVRQAVYLRMGKPVPSAGTAPNPLVVNISARHCHLTQEAVEAFADSVPKTKARAGRGTRKL